MDARDDLRAVAYHEAGHAVMAWSYGTELYAATVNGDEGTTDHGNPLFGVDIEWSEPDPAERLTARDLAEQAIRCSLAGDVAQEIGMGARPDPAGGEDDRLRAWEILGHLVGSTEELEAYANLLEIQARQRLRRLWPAVEALAGELVRAGEVDGARARELCEVAIYGGRRAEG